MRFGSIFGDDGDIFASLGIRPGGIPGIVEPKHEHLLSYEFKVTNRIRLYAHILNVGIA